MNVLTLYTHAVLFAEYENFPLSTATYCVKVAAVLLVTLPLSLLKSISQLEKVWLQEMSMHTIMHYSYCFMQVSAICILCISITFCIAIYEGVISFCAVRCFNPDCCRASISLWAISPTIAEVLLLDQYTRVGSYPRHLHGESMPFFVRMYFFFKWKAWVQG